MLTNRVQASATPQAPHKPSALALMAGKLSVDPNKLLDTLKATVFSKATTEELLALVVVANQYDLNPLLKEIYAFPAKGGGIVPIVSVDGWNKMLIRQPDFDGIEFAFEHGQDGQLISCTATIYTKSRSRPVSVTEYFDECKRNTDPWNNMPHRMLRNRTLCQASRMAFGFSGVHNEEEAADIVIESLPSVDTSRPPAQQLAPPAAPVAARKSKTDELADAITGAGFTFDDLAAWGVKTGNLSNADSWTGFSEVSESDAKRLLRAIGPLIEDLTAVKQGGAQ